MAAAIMAAIIMAFRKRTATIGAAAIMATANISVSYHAILRASLAMEQLNPTELSYKFIYF